MKQKLGLSCALIHQPALLLLDEPTFGVDPISRRELWLIIHEMVATGVTAVVSTSYLDEAERFDRLVFLHRGARIALDAPDALRAEFEGELVSARVPRARDAAPVARSIAGVRRVVVFGDRLHLTVESAAREGAAVAAALRAQGFEVGDPGQIEPTLEDVFIERVERADAS
jgi:ABC-2 type transport system ATP-binding protein